MAKRYTQKEWVDYNERLSLVGCGNLEFETTWCEDNLLS